MVTKIIKWPPIKARGVEFTVDQPISESVSTLNTDTRYVSQYKPEKRVVTMVVSGRNNSGSAGGYVNQLKRFLQGGVHLVRLDTLPSHFNLDWKGLRGQVPMNWTSTDREMGWEASGLEMLWLTGELLTGTTFDDNGWQGLRVGPFEPNTIVAYPDELVRVGTSKARVIKLEYSDDTGYANLRLDGPITSGDVILGDTESAIYKLESIPRSVQYAGEDWEYEFNFREVFENEIRGAYEEVNPWH